MSTLTQTENGALAFSTTGSKNLDFFTRIVRGAPVSDYLPTFVDAWNEDPVTSLRVLMNLRDVRSGKGEREIPQVLLAFLRKAKPETYKKMLRAFVDLGYYKDLLVIADIASVFDTLNGGKPEFALFAEQLKKDATVLDANPNAAISLAAKWAPREASHYDKHYGAATLLAKEMGMKIGQYRKLVSRLSKHLNILEAKLTSGDYESIDFSKLPSAAHRLHRTLFKRGTTRDGKEDEKRMALKTRYEAYLAALERGDKGVKINVTGTQPHQLVEHYFDNPSSSVDETIEAQWRALEQRVRDRGTFKRTMAVVDVSGSMAGTPMLASIALGILIAGCTEGSFANNVISFHETPSWFELPTGTLEERVAACKRIPWGGSTDIGAVFQLMLTMAKACKLSADQMPETLFIFTDMQFNKVDGVRSNDRKKTTFELIKEMYADSGYTPPRIVCWNLRTSDAKTLPFGKDENGVCTLSGFSAEMLNAVLDMQEITPMLVLESAISAYTAEIAEGEEEPITLDAKLPAKFAKVIKRTRVKPCKKEKGSDQSDADSE